MTPKVFRAMKCDASGTAPLAEASARGLGVRPRDLEPCELGLARPNRGGMSVAPSLTDLPRWRVPVAAEAITYALEHGQPKPDLHWVRNGAFSRGAAEQG